MRRLMLLALAAGTALSVVGAGYPAVAKESKGGCAVQYLDERGNVQKTGTDPEGAKRGAFRCVGGVWQYSWAPYTSDDLITAPSVQVDPKGRVSVREFDRPERATDLTLRQMAGIERAVTGAKEVTFARAVVAVDDGKKRTPAQVAAILAGKDSTGAKILRTIDKPNLDGTVQGIGGDIGGQDPVVVYLLSEIWDAIIGAVGAVIDWVVDGLNGIGDWIHNHCIWFPPPLPGDTDVTIITCEF